MSTDRELSIRSVREPLRVVVDITVHDMVVGEIVATDAGHDEQAHITWSIVPPFEGQGIVSWALRESLPHLLSRWNRLVAIIRPGNHPSKHLAEAVGFRLEGIAREGRVTARGYEDVEHWAIIARDLPGAYHEDQSMKGDRP